MAAGRRLLVYDRTCTRPPFLTQSWVAGALIARVRGRLDAAYGARDWASALDWLASTDADAPIAEIQFWGHGKWGRIYIDDDILDAGALSSGHPLHPKLEAIRERMNPEARWWFRSCETFGADAGHDFAMRLVDWFGRPAAGHTYIIGPWQSGLHRLEPGQRPDWSTDEGLVEGSPAAPRRAAWSRAWHPRTINCLRMDIPAGW